MSTFTRPVPSSIGGIDFGVLSNEEIKSISVKRIYNTPSLDSFNNPVPGGLYDTALGAWGDHICSTCRQNSWSCAGHSGHIEFPVHVYNVTFFDQLFRLLRAQCIYCHHFRMSKIQVSKFIAKLRLLQYGLVEEAIIAGNMELRKGGRNNDASDSDDSEDEDDDDLIKRRDTYVKRCIKALSTERKNENYLQTIKNPAAAEQRRNTVRDFFKEANGANKCTRCTGISPPYRRDKYSKIFRKAFSQKARAAMSIAGFQIPNSLVLMEEANRLSKRQKAAMKPSQPDGAEEDDDDSTHGAERQISMGNAVLMDVEERRSTNKEGEQNDDSQQYVPSSEVYACLRFLFEKEQEVLDLVYDSRPSIRKRSHVSPDMFFIKNILVPPNKYRPAAPQGQNEILEAQQNSSFNKIIKLCDQVNQISKERQGDSTESVTRTRDYRDLLQTIVQLQDAVNSLIDCDRNPSQIGTQSEDGIKQRLEKKDGLFRKNMMGKRVNFAARSVISPDPNIETNEIGIPLVFAKKLTYPEPVTNHNYWELKQAVMNGPDIYPGASAVENEVGQVVSLKFKSVDERVAIANLLLSPSNWKLKRSRNKKVYRHLTTGDVVLMNRQPTLHKPSIMGHRARVLQGERTIRMHYANCNTYNADFDGDEMNLHFPQNEIARAEAMQLADTDHQYLVATSGKPLRGLIQDHISMGVWFTCRNSFFDQDDYHQLLYSCLRPESSHTVTDKIFLMPPSILRPEPRWTGKQIISTVLKNITPDGRVGLNLTGKSQTPGHRWGVDSKEEGEIIIKDGELLCGILDKAQLGPTTGGLIHSIHEVYGHVVAGKLIGILGRLLTKFLHMRAFTCGMDDLRLTQAGNEARAKTLKDAEGLGRKVALQYVTLDENKVENEDAELDRRLEDALRDEEKHAGLDSIFNSRTAPLSSSITDACLPLGLEKPFPWNQMQAMTISGAKGSMVNANLISCNLGQQVLEGRRVPVMISGKTLPSFKPYDTNIMAGGYVTGRFLTGIKPQEYYFHAMAGREGLIDTAVKTSRSGYLQRCLIKGMEGLKAEYDTSVRDTSDGSLVQFLYGEDGLDITKQKHLQDFSFLAQNYESILSQVNGERDFSKIHSELATKWTKSALKKVKKDGIHAKDPAMAHYPPGANYGSTSESFAQALKKYEKANPDHLLQDKTKSSGVINKKSFNQVMNIKYMRSVVDPGEAVGIVAGQSVGEPSTQMTLNTFHLAGHSTKNVTLGIPRLREIVMTASTHIMTPTMTAILNKQTTEETRKLFAKTISKLTLAEVVDKLRVRERISSGHGSAKAKVYDIQIEFFPSKEYIEEYAIQIADVLETLQHKFVPRLIKLTTAELKKRTNEKSLSNPSAAQPDIGTSVGVVEEGPRSGGREGNGDDDDDEDQDDAKRAKASQNRSHQVSYEAPDDAEKDIIREQDSPEPESDDEEREASARAPVSDDEDTDMEDAGDSDSEKKNNSKDREDILRGKFPELTRFKFNPKKGSSCTIQLQYDVSSPKLLLLPLLESAARTSVIQFIPGLGDCTYVPEKNSEPAHAVTDGVNLIAMRDYQDIIDPHTLYTNSISHMLTLYGVEAARASIVREIDGVFKGHGIAVDNRHMNLIGDVMTQAGGFRPFNRMGIVKDSTSPLMKMSFETTVRFLRDAVLERDWDNLLGPSGRIVTGRVGTVGTGAFDVMAPVG